VTPPQLSIVIPMHNTRAHLEELTDRLVASTPGGTEFVFVDDGCPQGSGAAVRLLDVPGRLVTLRPCVGQHAAVLIGLAHARGDRVAVIDADLQDRPEDLPQLLAAVSARCPVVCAGRRGDYESGGRRRSGRWYRRTLSTLTRGAVPPDAGMFLVMTREALSRVLAVSDPLCPLVPAVARAGLPIRSFPISREAREGDRSATSTRTRLRVATRGLVTVTPLYPLARRLRVARWTPPVVDVVDLRPSQEGAPWTT
jgi:dolichol-phosphate mannosyltransferase